MLQVKILAGSDLEGLNSQINSFLANLATEAVKDISISLDTMTAIIQYDIQDAWVEKLCVDCKHWDSGQHASVIGLCQECGGRKRFNNQACQQFKDVRG